jgi:hypothetical protein
MTYCMIKLKSVNPLEWLIDVSHDIASSEKWCQCLDKKVQDFSVVKQNSNMRISK